MSHSPALIHQICELLRQEYDVALYDYVIEKMIPGTRMFPDILVVDRASRKRQCAVEIGYTRPEKLTAYRTKLKIPDVRWYDKQGNLHADVTEKTVKVSLELAPRYQMYVYAVGNQVRCVGEDCGKCACDDDGIDRISCANFEDCFERQFYDVSTTIVTDRVKAFFPSFCDKCGAAWLANPEDEAAELAFSLIDMSAKEFGLEYGARTEMTWDQACQLVEDRYDIKLNYPDGAFLWPEAKNTLEQHRLESVRIVKKGAS